MANPQYEQWPNRPYSHELFRGIDVMRDSGALSVPKEQAVPLDLERLAGLTD